MGSIEAISWFLIERNTIKRFTPIRLPVVVAVQGKDFWRRAGFAVTVTEPRISADRMGLRAIRPSRRDRRRRGYRIRRNSWLPRRRATMEYGSDQLRPGRKL
jgi:hypothetical protein